MEQLVEEQCGRGKMGSGLKVSSEEDMHMDQELSHGQILVTGVIKTNKLIWILFCLFVLNFEIFLQLFAS